MKPNPPPLPLRKNIFGLFRVVGSGIPFFWRGRLSRRCAFGRSFYFWPFRRIRGVFDKISGERGEGGYSFHA